MVAQGPADNDLVAGFTPNSHKSVTKMLTEAGYDGIVYENALEDAGSTSYVTFSPNQIKSTFNRGAFDPADPNILNQDGFSAVSTTEVRFTPERFESLLEDVTDLWNRGISSKSDPLFSLAFVNPQEFVEGLTDAAYTAEQAAENAGPLDAERLASERQTPYIRLDSDRTIVGHEGRHRMAALAAAGYTSVPIRLLSPDPGNFESDFTVRGSSIKAAVSPSASPPLYRSIAQTPSALSSQVVRGTGFSCSKTRLTVR